MRDGGARHAREEEERALHRSGPLLFGGVVGPGQRRAAGVVDQDVQAPEALDGLRDQLLDRVVPVEIAREREHVPAGGTADLLRGLLEVVARAAAHGDPNTLLGQHLRAGAAEPLTGSPDDRDLVLQLEIHGLRSGFLEAAVALDLHERLDAGAQGRPTARDRGGLDRLEQLALGRAVLDGAPHVGDDAVLKASIREDADDDHLAVLDRELLALAHRQGAQRTARLDVLRIFLRDPVPERVAVRAGGLAVDLAVDLLRASAHRGLLASFIGAGLRETRPKVSQGCDRMPPHGGERRNATIRVAGAGPADRGSRQQADAPRRARLPDPAAPVAGAPP